MRPIIEICLENAQSVLNAQLGGADRVELCSDLFEGGLTPTLGTFRTARKLADKIKINVMIRPRGGDFCYSKEEFEVMKEDLHIFKEEGANGFVFGILSPEGVIDEERTAQLIEMAGTTSVTFHRAFDMTKDGKASLETLIKLGATRVLTSGLEPTVPEGAFFLRELVQQAGDRIIVMPGCGINERNFKKMQEIIGAKEYHVFVPHDYNSKMEYHPEHIYMGGMLRQSEFTLSETSKERVCDICQTC